MEIVIDLHESGAVCVGVQYMEEGNGALIKESRILFLDCGPSGCRPFSYVITPVVRSRDTGTDLVIAIYRSCVRQFSIAKNVVSTNGHPNLAGALAFSRWYARNERICVNHAVSNIRPARAAWAFAREILGENLPPWQVPIEPLKKMPPILQEFAEHLRRHRGNPESTLRVKMCFFGAIPFVSDRSASMPLQYADQCGAVWNGEGSGRQRPRRCGPNV
jgi:hypothetical protein